MFGLFIKEIPEIAKNRSTYPHVISHKSKNILDIDLRFFLKDAQVNSAHSKTKNGPLRGPQKPSRKIFLRGGVESTPPPRSPRVKTKYMVKMPKNAKKNIFS